MKTLVVFYSRSGHTREVGHRVAAALHADMEEIGDRVNRRGVFGFLRSGRDAWFERRTELLPVARDPGAYDLVIIGTPIWNMSLSTPVRTYLQDHRSRFREVAFFCTMGGFGAERVFEKMSKETGHQPVATLALTERDLVSPDLAVAIRSFTYRLKTLRHAA